MGMHWERRGIAQGDFPDCMLLQVPGCLTLPSAPPRVLCHVCLGRRGSHAPGKQVVQPGGDGGC